VGDRHNPHGTPSNKKSPSPVRPPDNFLSTAYPPRQLGPARIASVFGIHHMRHLMPSPESQSQLVITTSKARAQPNPRRLLLVNSAHLSLEIILLFTTHLPPTTRRRSAQALIFRGSACLALTPHLPRSPHYHQCATIAFKPQTLGHDVLDTDTPAQRYGLRAAWSLQASAKWNGGGWRSEGRVPGGGSELGECSVGLFGQGLRA